MKGILGIALIVQSVAILSLSAGASQGSENMTEADIQRDSTMTRMSILCAVFAALSFALHSLFFKVAVAKFDAELNQLTYDSAGLFSLILLTPLFLKVSSGDLKIEPYPVLLSMVSFNLTNVGAQLSSHSIKYGKAGVV